LFGLVSLYIIELHYRAEHMKINTLCFITLHETIVGATDDAAEDLRDDETCVLDALREQHQVEAERIDVEVLRELSPRRSSCEAQRPRCSRQQGRFICYAAT
jgi:hypothetical protein